MSVSHLKSVLVLLAAGILLAGCSSGSSDKRALKTLDPFAGTGSPRYERTGSLPHGGGRYHMGKPYQVAGRWYHPKEQPGYDKTGMASWYGEAFHRRQTSNGEWFDMNRMTAAHPTLPLPSYARVTNEANGKSIIVRINDRGPFVGTRLIDMSKRAAEALDFKRQGKAEVRVQWIGLAPLQDNGTHLAQMNRELARGTPLRTMVASVAKPKTWQTETVAAAERPEEYFVQVGSFSDPENAERTREELANVADVNIQELRNTAGDTVYRVRLGPIASERKANEVLQAAMDQGHSDARLIVAQVL